MRRLTHYEVITLLKNEIKCLNEAADAEKLSVYCILGRAKEIIKYCEEWENLEEEEI